MFEEQRLQSPFEDPLSISKILKKSCRKETFKLRVCNPVKIHKNLGMFTKHSRDTGVGY